MLNILLLTILISFVTMGARIITQEHFVGGFIRIYALRIGTIMKPFITCVVCMPSAWGTGIHLLINWTSPQLELNIYHLPLEILSACFINSCLWIMYNIIRKHFPL